MLRVDIDLTEGLSEQIFRIQTKLAEPNQGVRLVGKLGEANNRSITEATIKALMVCFRIDEYAEEVRADFLVIKYTLVELEKTKSDFVYRSLGRMALLIGASIPVGLGVGSIATGLAWAFVVGGPVGMAVVGSIMLTAIAVCFGLAVIAAGITALVQTAKENQMIAQLQKEIEEGNEIVDTALSSVDFSPEDSESELESGSELGSEAETGAESETREEVTKEVTEEVIKKVAEETKEETKVETEKKVEKAAEMAPVPISLAVPSGATLFAPAAVVPAVVPSSQSTLSQPAQQEALFADPFSTFNGF